MLKLSAEDFFGTITSTYFFHRTLNLFIQLGLNQVILLKIFNMISHNRGHFLSEEWRD